MARFGDALLTLFVLILIWVPLDFAWGEVKRAQRERETGR